MKTHEIISSRIENGYFIYTYSDGRQIIKNKRKNERMG